MAGEGQVIVINTSDAWREYAKNSNNKLIVIDFTASWCGPCRIIAPVFAELAKKFPQATFLKVDVDDVQAVAQEFRVEAMPTFVFFKDGKEIDRFVGADKDGLQAAVVKHSTSTASTTSTSSTAST